MLIFGHISFISVKTSDLRVRICLVLVLIGSAAAGGGGGGGFGGGKGGGVSHKFDLVDDFCQVDLSAAFVRLQFFPGGYGGFDFGKGQVRSQTAPSLKPLTLCLFLFVSLS